MSETTQTATDAAPVDVPEAVVTEDVTEMVASEDVTDVDEAVAIETPEAVAETPATDTPVEAAVAASGVAAVRQARVYLCERGHRVTALWRVPTVCPCKITRTGPPCGQPLYAIGELPEQVQKALNPLKASKKSSKKK